MKYLIPMLFAASPALAYDAGHVHSHGGEGWIAVVPLAALIGLSILLRKRSQ